MKRRELLQSNLTEEKNVKTVVDTTVAKDQKFLKRAKRDLEDEIEDAEESLKNRLSSDTAIDKATIEQVYGDIKVKKAKLQLYTDFEKEYLTESNQ